MGVNTYALATIAIISITILVYVTILRYFLGDRPNNSVHDKLYPSLLTRASYLVDLMKLNDKDAFA